MAEWKREIRELAKGFCIPRDVVIGVIKRVEKVNSKRVMPDYYKGNRNEFLYDNAYREIKNIIYA